MSWMKREQQPAKDLGLFNVTVFLSGPKNLFKCGLCVRFFTYRKSSNKTRRYFPFSEAPNVDLI